MFTNLSLWSEDLAAGRLLPTLVVSFCFGTIFHQTIRQKEIDYQIWRRLTVHSFSNLALCVYYKTRCSFTVFESIRITTLASFAFNLGFAASIVTYRLFLHRLKRFPGPVFAKISRFYATRLAAKDVRYAFEVEKLHRKYGDFVRTGPRELSILRASAVPAIYGPQTECRKSTWYSQVSDDVTKCSLNSSRDFEDHKRRRRAWDRGFSVKALQTYEPRIKTKIDLFISRIKEFSGSPINITQWSMFFNFDTMGAVGFGKEFRMLDNGTEHPAIKGLHDQMTVLGILSSVPWLLSMLGAIPGLAGSYALFTKWCAEQAEQKEKVFDPAKEPSDIFSWLLKAKLENDPSASRGQALVEDSRLIIIAGSDTTASALANCLFFLTRHPETYRKLQNILNQILPRREADWPYEKVKAIPYLDGIINETLRLKPPIPGGGPRVTPTAGLWVDEVYIPGDINVIVPAHAIHRDARCFKKPEEFIPERWMDEKTGLIKDKLAYAPFSLGAYGCIGKNLAMMQLRSIISRIAMNFDLSFAPGENGDSFDKEAMDTFTLTLPPLHLVLKNR